MRRSCHVLREIVRIYNEGSQKPISKTKLTGLFYLFERSYYQENNYTLTGSPYINYHNGPHNEKIEDLIRESTINHLFHVAELTDDQHIRYELCNCPVHQKESDLSEEIYRIVNSVVDEHGNKNASELIKYLKSLPEVTSKEKYGLIDFNDVQS